MNIPRLIGSGLVVFTGGFILGRVIDRKTWYWIELVLLPDVLNPMLVSSSVPWYDGDEEDLCAKANERRRAWLKQQLEE